MPWLIYDGKAPRVALYTRCEDELLARAELLVSAEEALEKRKGIAVYGYYDVDPSLSIEQFKRTYRGDHKRYQKLMEAREKILKEGWPYTWVENQGG
jgi:hypothetical protein